MTFDEWMDEVSIQVYDRTGVNLTDLPDHPYRVWFDEGQPPTGAANMVMEAGI